MPQPPSHGSGLLPRNAGVHQCVSALQVDCEWTVKVCDFNLSSTTVRSARIGTSQWAAPELLCGVPATKASVRGLAGRWAVAVLQGPG